MNGAAPGLVGRWWTYQAERFPLLAHGPLIAAFSACAVAFSACLLGAAVPPWPVYGVAFLVCLLFFLQLRIADEFKDAEDDARWRPYRPVPRGLVALAELRLVFIASAVIQAVASLALDPRLVWVLAAGWAYLSLMSVEFFARDWLKARPIFYLLTHMGIMPLVDLFATACQWLPAVGKIPAGLAAFLGASFCNGIVIEIGRKLRLSADEEEGVETYSKLWGRGPAVIAWLACMLVTAALAIWAAARIGFAGPLAVALAVAFGIACGAAGLFARAKVPGKTLEALAGFWTLVLYLMLGVVPLLMRHS